MRRLKVTHCRDARVLPGWRWDVWEDDTGDAHAEPTWLAYGSHEACLAFAIGLAELRAVTGVKP